MRACPGEKGLEKTLSRAAIWVIGQTNEPYFVSGDCPTKIWIIFPWSMSEKASQPLFENYKQTETATTALCVNFIQFFDWVASANISRKASVFCS